MKDHKATAREAFKKQCPGYTTPVQDNIFRFLDSVIDDLTAEVRRETLEEVSVLIVSGNRKQIKSFTYNGVPFKNIIYLDAKGNTILPKRKK